MYDIGCSPAGFSLLGGPNPEKRNVKKLTAETESLRPSRLIDYAASFALADRISTESQAR